MLTLILLSWMLSVIFVCLNHPLSLGLILLTQTIIISIISGMMNFDYWFSYILFLIMIGGMLVLFLYMTSVASNEKFKFSNKMMFSFMIFFMFSFMFIFLDNFYCMIDSETQDYVNQSNQLMKNLTMNKFMNFPSMLIMILMMIYLLLTLIAIVKITQSKMGPLRQMNS
uniref:NADH dehydrogenase subunit 6 n=1 Tax=Chlorophanus auripes TaxID=2907322 RepID=UPI001F12DF3A|nr:NADH dehydrogenase subunit 6 [Chlorophanus auripes]UKT60166.1 NADH dehydrogenase subunit 6 [Chlorophanus auripes]